MKIEWLERIDRETRAMDPRIVQVMASCHAVHEVILVASSDGALAADVRPLVRINVSVIAEQDGRREQGYAGAGGRYTLAELVEGGKPAEARARGRAPGAGESRGGARTRGNRCRWCWRRDGRASCCTKPSAMGSKGDFNRKGTSAFSNRIGERVASEHCTVVDDGTLPGRRGSLNIDDEGTPSQCTTLIENGVLKGYLQDTHNARLMGTRSTGNGRRESFAHMTMPRMTNTYMRPGPHDPAEIIASVDRGHLRGEFRRRPGGHHLRQVRVFRQRGLPHRERPHHRADQGRHADRQWSGCADARLHGRQRPEAG